MITAHRTNMRDLFTYIERKQYGVKKVGYSTFEYTKEGVRRIIFHKTDIIKFNPNGSVTLNSGGWQTPTTLKKINQFSGNIGYVRQRKYYWYYYFCLGVIPFEDGMTVWPEPIMLEKAKKGEFGPEIQLKAMYGANNG